MPDQFANRPRSRLLMVINYPTHGEDPEIVRQWSLDEDDTERLSKILADEAVTAQVREQFPNECALFEGFVEALKYQAGPGVVDL